MNEYIKGVWETLNYSIRCVKEKNRSQAIEEMNKLKEQIEVSVAIEFKKKQLYD